MEPLIKTSISYNPTKILKRILNRINKSIAKKNIKKNFQLVIFSFDHIGLSINLDGRYENSQLNLLEQFITKKMKNSNKQIALDIGANIGNHSLFLSKYFEKVYSFEPNPITFDVLSINTKYLADKKNIITYNFGLSDIENELPFIVNSDNIGGSKIISLDSKSSNPKKLLIKVKKADDIDILLKENISLIKIDVEGHEINSLKGAEKIIVKNKPVILFEQGSEEIIDKKSEVIEYLSGHNYSFYTMKQRFYFGESFIFRLFGVCLSSIFGEQLSFIKTTTFKKQFYDMILAIQKDQI